MNQENQKYNGNYGQFYSPSGQKLFIVSQGQQIGMNPQYSQYSYPNVSISQPWVYPQIQSLYPQYIICQQSKENSLYNKDSQNTNNYTSDGQQDRQYQNRQYSANSDQNLFKSDIQYMHNTSQAVNVKKYESFSQILPCQQGQFALCVSNQSHATKESINTSSYKNLQENEQEKDLLHQFNLNCLQNGVTDGSVSQHEHNQQPLEIKKKVYPKVDGVTDSFQAGYKFIDQCGGKHKTIQTISSNKQDSLMQQQMACKQFENQSMAKINSFFSTKTHFKDKNIDKNFGFDLLTDNTKKVIKNQQKYFQKQQKNEGIHNNKVKKSFQYTNNQNLNCELSENKTNYKQQAAVTLITEENQMNSNFNCVYSLIEKQRKQLIKENKNESGLAQILVDKLYSFSQFENKIEGENKFFNHFQKPSALQIQKKQSGTSLDMNNQRDNEILNKDQNCQYNSESDVLSPIIQYSNFLIQLKERGKEDQDNQQEYNLLSILQKKAIYYQNQQNKEASQLNQKILFKDLQFSKTNVQQQRVNKRQKKIQGVNECNSTIQSIALCEQLMESTQTHQRIFYQINQSQLSNFQNERFQNFTNQQISHNTEQILANIPHSFKSEDSNVNREKNLSLPSIQDNTEQIIGNFSSSTTSQEKILIPSLKQILQQQYHEFPFFQFSVKNPSLFDKFDFSQVRQITKKQRTARQQKQNSTYKANSKYHNMNKLLMYNIMSMFQIDNLLNFTLDNSIREHLAQIVKVLKKLSKCQSEKYKFEYFSRQHYHILFLKVTPNNLEFLANSEKDRYLHEKCYNVNFQKSVSAVELNYINIMKSLFLQIFMISIQCSKIIDDGSNSKQNLRRQYCQKAISGIKKLSLGEVLVRF